MRGHRHAGAAGRDHVIALGPSSRAASHLVDEVATALGATADDVDGLMAVLDALGEPTCLVIDDLHELGDDSDGVDALRELASRLPPQVHLVLASRRRIPLPLARARAAGHVVDLDESDLAYDGAELAELAERHRLPVDTLSSAAGWPALVALTVIAGKRGALDFLSEEVISGLDPKTLDVLTCAVLAQHAEPWLLRTVVGYTGDPHDIAAAVPMVAIDGDGTLTPHELWTPVVERHLLPDRATELLHQIADARRSQGQHDLAVRAAARAGDAFQLAEVIRDVSRLGHIALQIDVIDQWLELAPDQFAETPEGRLLVAISTRAANPFSEETQRLLTQSWLEFRELGVIGCEVVAMSELAFVLRSRGAPNELMAVITRLFELEALGHGEARPLAAFARAGVAEQLGDAKAGLAALDEIRPGDLPDGWMALVEFTRCNNLLLLGRPREALAAAKRSTALGSPGYVGGWCAARSAAWHLGVETEVLDRLPIAESVESTSLIDRIWIGTFFGAMQAFAGRLDLAARNIGAAEACLRAGVQPELLGFVAWARAAYAVADHHPDTARAALREFLDVHPLTSPLGSRVALRLPALVDQLVTDDERAVIRSIDLGPWQQEMLALSDTLDAVRRGDAGAAWPDPAVVMCALPVPWAVELACRGATLGHPQAVELAGHLLDVAERAVRDEVRVHLAPELRAAATKLFAGAAPPDRDEVVVRLLGPVGVDIGDAGERHPELARRRVRELLAAIAMAGPISRRELAAMLWDHLDESRATSNLRVNLSYLGRISSDDERIVVDANGLLSLAPAVTTDVGAFQHLVDEAGAAARAGATTVACDLLTRAVDLVAGPPLADTRDGDWFDREAERLTLLAARACAQAAALDLELDRLEAGVRHATQAIELDPWGEIAHQHLIAAHLQRGDRDLAAAAARRLQTVLDELDVPPEAASQRLIDAATG